MVINMLMMQDDDDAEYAGDDDADEYADDAKSRQGGWWKRGRALTLLTREDGNGLVGKTIIVSNKELISVWIDS